MALRNQVEWALHCCSVLSGLPPDEYLPTRTLAEFHGVPRDYLSKALQALAQAGLVEGTLGPTGGYRLAKPPTEISFLDIVEAIDGESHTFRCTEIRGNNPCLKESEKQFSNICGIARVMRRADDAWRAELRAMTLADLGEQLLVDIPLEILERGQRWMRSR